MDVYVIVLRLLHIAGGLIWVGSGLYMTWFVQPTARAAGDAGGVFMRNLMGETRAPAVMGLSALAALVSGVLLYWHDFGAVVPFNRTMGGLCSRWCRGHRGLAVGGDGHAPGWTPDGTPRRSSESR